MYSIKVTGIKETNGYLEAVSKNEMPFALAKALTTTAQDVQARIIADLPRRFTLRTKWYQPNTPFGFKIEKATKTSLVAKVYTTAPWMQLQETGGIKRAQGKRLAVPFEQKTGNRPGVVFGVKRTKRDLIMKSQKPQALGSKAFVIKGRRGDLLATRTGKGKRSVLRILYGLETQANVPARLRFAETAQEVVDRGWRRTFEEAIAFALRTSRR